MARRAANTEEPTANSQRRTLRRGIGGLASGTRRRGHRRYRLPSVLCPLSSVLCFVESSRDQPEREETSDENRDAGGVVPGRNSVDTLCRCNLGEQQRPAYVEYERQGEPRNHAKRAPSDAEGIQLAQEEGNHQRGLERADATARLVNSHHPGADLDDVAVLERRNA